MRVRIIVPQSVPLANIASLLRAGVAVRLLQQPYAHAKVILVDGVRAFVGSENFSATSLDHDREVGLLIRGPSLVRIASVFAADWTCAAVPPVSHSGRYVVYPQTVEGLSALSAPVKPVWHVELRSGSALHYTGHTLPIQIKHAGAIAEPAAATTRGLPRPL